MDEHAKIVAEALTKSRRIFQNQFVVRSQLKPREDFYEELSKFQVRPEGRHSLPFADKLPSRICSSIIFSQYGLAKQVIKLNLVLSK